MTDRLRIVLATCRAWPDISASDAELASELRSRGHTVDAASWNDAPTSAFTSADVVVLRSNWDYHHDLPAFEHWLDEVSASPVQLHNDASLVRDHLHKDYLLRLADQEVPTPKTIVLDEFDASAIRSWATAEQLDRVVLKPAWGASGHDVRLVELDDLDDETERWQTSDRRELLAQSFVEAIRDGETSLVFFGNEFSHALLRVPAPGDFRANSNYGSQMAPAPSVDPSKVEVARQALATLPVVPTYARVDVAGTGDSATLMELEINEPALGLHLAPGSAVRFADALLRPSGEPARN